MWMSVLEDWTNAAVMLSVIILLGVTHADVMMVIPEMALIAMVSIYVGHHKLNLLL